MTNVQLARRHGKTYQMMLDILDDLHDSSALDVAIRRQILFNSKRLATEMIRQLVDLANLQDGLCLTTEGTEFDVRGGQYKCIKASAANGSYVLAMWPTAPETPDRVLSYRPIPWKHRVDFAITGRLPAGGSARYPRWPSTDTAINRDHNDPAD